MLGWNLGTEMTDQEHIENTTATADTPAEHALTIDPVEQLAAVTAERDQFAQEKADLTDRLLRKQAEFDNFRRRTEREREDFADYANMEAIRPLLGVLDDFERALKAAPADGGDFVKGIQLIYSRFADTLTKLGLEPINSVGQKFDPHLHHAVQKAESGEVEEDTVLEEYQKGYNYRGKLLRPAMVKVSVR
jgi:molecular chaperone GrpE